MAEGAAGVEDGNDVLVFNMEEMNERRMSAFEAYTENNVEQQREKGRPLSRRG